MDMTITAQKIVEQNKLQITLLKHCGSRRMLWDIMYTKIVKRL